MSSVKAEKKVSEDKKGKVTRYRAGRAPEWVGKDEDEVNDSIQNINIKVERKSDPRLDRLQKTRIDKDEALRRRREVVAEIISTNENQEDEDTEADERQIKREEEQEEAEEVEMEIDSDDEARRQRARLQYLKKKEQEEELSEQEGEGEEEEESEYETDSEYEDDFHSRPTFQPVFVRKENRETIAEREKLEEEYERLEESRLQQLEQRKKDTQQLLKQEIAKEKEEIAKAAEEGDDEKVLSDEEEENEAKEYELWKLREIARIKRDKEEREMYLKEQEDTEKRRFLSDLEIRQMDREKFVKDKKKWKFLQKYYHKGAFFKEGDEEDIQNQDYSEATGEDLIDKTLLPKVMQVKNFGRSGRTKYTHLTDQDTTKWDAGWMNNDSIRSKYTQKMGGMHSSLERPSLKRKHSD